MSIIEAILFVVVGLPVGAFLLAGFFNLVDSMLSAINRNFY